MITYNITDYTIIYFDNLVLDFNGTIATDGQLIKGVKELLNKLSEDIKIHIITADTFGTVIDQVKEINCDVKVIEKDDQITQKENFILKLGKERTIAVGNGKNDVNMLKVSRLGICIIGEECAYTATVQNSDIISSNILNSLELLLNPQRMKALLRN